MGQAVPNFQNFFSAVGASVTVYDIISQVTSVHNDISMQNQDI